jgi:hypothetical protein
MIMLDNTVVNVALPSIQDESAHRPVRAPVDPDPLGVGAMPHLAPKKWIIPGCGSGDDP